MRLSQQTKNAVSVLVLLAKAADRSVTVPEIAESCGITEYNTFKLVPLLVRGGFAKTIRGRNGGVQLAQPAEDISVGSVVRAVEHKLLSAGAGDQSEPVDSEVSFEAMVDDALLAFVEILDQNTIAELARGGSAPKSRKSRKNMSSSQGRRASKPTEKVASRHAGN